MSLILASQSARRRQLLSEAGYSFEVRPPPDSAETPRQPGEPIAKYVVRLARQKAAAVAEQVAGGTIIACDTIAVIDDQILGKPADRDDARRMLGQLRGRRHQVWSGLCLWNAATGAQVAKAVSTTLLMANLSDAQIAEYLASNLWQGKAGAFGYQDRLGWLTILDGSESNVVGLPMERLSELLAQFPAGRA